MDTGKQFWLFKKFPQNYLLRKPLYGALLIAAFTFLFAILYRPLGSHASRYFGYELTMALYSLVAAASMFGMIKMLGTINYFSKASDWTLMKEIAAILLVLTGMGIAIYFAAFLIEEPADRWNFATLADSVKRSFLIGIIPFAFFSLMSRRRWVEVSQQDDSGPDADAEEMIQISSQLKKETLSFYPGQLIYAESDSNYVNFYIYSDGKVQKKIIRNSINNIEQQLAGIPWLMRTHRAFIVNLKKISAKKGNSLGYRLRLHGVEKEIPVSRSNAGNFSKAYR